MSRLFLLWLTLYILLGCALPPVKAIEINSIQTHEIAQSGNIRLIESAGYGTDVDAATRNAVENALKQVVGSFIDSTTTINKNKIITNGIVNATKNIIGKTREYSRGSIRSVNITSIRKENSLYRVTASVSVADKEFKNYIEKIAYGDTRVGRGSLLKLHEDNNAYSSFEILQDRNILPIAKGLLKK